ncbi:MAG: cache domain-containing protein [Candidatus Saccharibacteria bacterium]
MQLQFIGQNVHFAVSLLASLAVFAVFWLTFDAWLERRHWREAIKWSGFLVLALGLLLNGAITGSGNLASGMLSTALPVITLGLRIAGYALIAFAQLLDPLMKRPDSQAVDAGVGPVPQSWLKRRLHMRSALVGGGVAKLIFMPALPLFVAGLYWRRATTGLERHLRPVALGFGLLALYELFAALDVLQGNSNPLVYTWVAAYGPVWWIAQSALLAAGVVLGRWVWQYLTKRIISQVFIVLVTTTVVIYFVSTAGFSLLLLRNTRSQALDDLTTASHVLDYALTSREGEIAAQAESVALRPGIAAAATVADHKAMIASVGDFAVTHRLSSLVFTDADGRVLLRAEDPNRWGDSLSNDSLVQRALIGRIASSVAVRQGVVAPNVNLMSTRPIRDGNGLIVGTVTVAQTISSAFVDGIRSATGLESSIYGGDVRAATTLLSGDGLHRAIGLRETNDGVLRAVLKEGKSYSGDASFQNRDYLAAYAPLKDENNNTVGMLLVARPADSLLAAAGRLVELAFLVSVGLLAVSVLPVYAIARKISEAVR